MRNVTERIANPYTWSETTMEISAGQPNGFQLACKPSLLMSGLAKRSEEKKRKTRCSLYVNVNFATQNGHAEPDMFHARNRDPLLHTRSHWFLLPGHHINDWRMVYMCVFWLCVRVWMVGVGVYVFIIIFCFVLCSWENGKCIWIDHFVVGQLELFLLL